MKFVYVTSCLTAGTKWNLTFAITTSLCLLFELKPRTKTGRPVFKGKMCKKQASYFTVIHPVRVELWSLWPRVRTLQLVSHIKKTWAVAVMCSNHSNCTGGTDAFYFSKMQISLQDIISLIQHGNIYISLKTVMILYKILQGICC